MGQQSSSNLQEFVANSVTKFICNDPSTSSHVWDEMHSMTYEDFLKKLGEFNKLSQNTFDSSGNRLVFLVKKGTNRSMFWKATLQIACVKLGPNKDIKVLNYGLLNLKEFLQIFETMKEEYSMAEESKKHDLMSQLLANTDFKPDTSKEMNECCICFERTPDISLPCAHTYCMQCIEEWNEDHDTCPICREHIDNTDDTWVLSEVPKSEEICEDIRTTLMALAESHNRESET